MMKIHQTLKSHIRTGPRPDETDRLKQAMRDMGLTELKRSTLEELMARLGSKQTATWQAKKDVLSDLEKGISQKTPNKEN